MDEVAALPHGPPMNILPPTPAGLDSLYSLCRKIYPDQVNPLQVTALIKYWLGGPDPLDYISMYANPGIPHENIPPHWHYISFGLSDLHGDGRVHDIISNSSTSSSSNNNNNNNSRCRDGPDSVSGFGFELTFRLKREPEETSPPTWPATLMQSLAKYVFQSGNTLCAGDHVSWHCALDNSESRIKHMLMTTDIQLKSTQTPFGNVDFVQIVGVCTEELKAAQQWNGAGILDMMITRLPSAGGIWHITDMRRGESIFELDLNAHEQVERGFELDGSNLSGVSATRCSWTEYANDQKNRKTNHHSTLLQTTTTTTNLKLLDSTNNILESTELLSIKKLEGVHLTFNLEAGSLLPLAIRGRVKHGRHFTFKSVLGETAITLVANSVTGTLVDNEYPYVAAQGSSWLQILICDDLAQDMAITFQQLANPEQLSLPKTFSWPERKLTITIVADK